MANNKICSAFFSAVVLAAAPAAMADIDWNYAQIGYERTEIDAGGGDFDGDGIRLEGSYGFTGDWYVFGSYATSDIDVGSIDVDFDVLTAGVGIHSSTSNTMQYFGQLGFVDFEGDGGSESGFLAAVGVRNEFNTQFQGKAAVEYFEPVEDSELGLLLEGLYEFTDQFGATVDLRFSDDITRFGVNFRVTF